MGIAYKLCDCRFNDTREEENLAILINKEILKLSSSNYSSNDFQNYSFLESIKRKNAVNLIIKNYRKYKLRTSIDNTSRINDKTKIKNSKTYNINMNDIDKYDLNTQNSTNDKFFHKKTLLYTGQKINGLKEGFGIKQMPNNVKYIGYFKHDKSEGYGKFINSDKEDYYYGEFSQDQANGFGIYHHKNESLYYGEWKDDLRENYGIEKWQDNSEYIGEFHLGEKNGIGKYIFNDGSRYEGEWKKNNLDGYGIYYYLGNRIYIGQWKNNLKNGYGQFIWKDKIYIGFYSNDKKNGFGIYYWKNNKKAFIGFWKNGKQYGFGKLISDNKIKFGIWINDNLEISYNDNEAFKELDKHKLGRYKHMFLFDLNDIDIYCNKDNIWQSLLDYSNQFTIE